MSLRRPRAPLTRRLPIALAAGALALATAVTPALAADDPGQGNQNNQSNQSGQNSHNNQSGQGNQNGQGNQSSQNTQNNQNTQNSQGNWSQQGGNGNNTGSHQQGNSNNNQQTGGDHGDHGDQGEARGVVTVQRLALRSAPERGSQVIRYAHKGDVVHIFCQAQGGRVDGNSTWYLLTDGTWAWGPARYIDTFGPAPRWC
ncbi:SH3 domain-containing protein [Streptomyces pseudogriseolus]|uniref:SH3 domain-containing protein n=1 Tax=Streptomyces pseudogriseolus TaxID=36817 RepID=UPI00324CF790